MEQQSPSLNDCLKLLKGARDEQRLAGLLLVTKFVKGDDYSSILRVYNAVGVEFLDRLLKTGMGKGVSSSTTGSSSSSNAGGDENRDAYLQLSVTILSTFCRINEIASSKEMVMKVPMILEVISKGSCLPGVVQECYDFLLLVLRSSEAGVLKLCECGGIKVLTFQISDGSELLKQAIELVKLVIAKLSFEKIKNEYPRELAGLVAAMTKQFAMLHNDLKFELLQLLSVILSSKDSSFAQNANFFSELMDAQPIVITLCIASVTGAQLRDVLHSMSNEYWPTYMRAGIVAVLQNRVAPAQRLQALVLAESIISVTGERWLIDQRKLSDIQEVIPADRCLLLVLESSRVEVAVLLNDIAYLKFEASKTSSTAEKIVLRQQNLATVFSLIEKIISLISSISVSNEPIMSDITLQKVVSQLNETVSVVLDYLQDAKEHKEHKGNDLLASVRVVGSYLAESPLSCREKVRELLRYMLSVEGEDETSPFYSTSFLLPMLCQITMDIDGCRIVASCGGLVTVVEYLITLIGTDNSITQDDGSIFLACDTIMNLLIKGEQGQVRIILDESTVIHLLKALSCWSDACNEPSVTMMASSICSLVLDCTSEKDLLNYPDFGRSIYATLTRLIVRSLTHHGQVKLDEENSDLLEIIASGSLIKAILDGLVVFL